MRKVLFTILIFLGTSAFADQDEYCAGWEIGFKTAMGNNNVYVPYCPYAGYAQYGTTYFQKGLKEGMEKGYQDKN